MFFSEEQERKKYPAKFRLQALKKRYEEDPVPWPSTEDMATAFQQAAEKQKIAKRVSVLPFILETSERMHSKTPWGRFLIYVATAEEPTTTAQLSDL